MSTRAAEPLRPGSAESDYLRVHARYFLEGSRVWIATRLLSLILVAAADHDGDRGPRRQGWRASCGAERRTSPEAGRCSGPPPPW